MTYSMIERRPSCSDSEQEYIDSRLLLPSTRIRSLLLDWDMTVVDSFGGAYRSHVLYALARGHEPITQHQLKSVWGTAMDCMSEELYPGHGADFMRFRDEAMIQPELIPEADIALKILAEDGIHIGIISSGIQATVQGSMEHVGINPDMFTCIFTSEETHHVKPDPRAFTGALEHMNTHGTRGSATYVGDAIHDLRGARRASVPFVGVLTGFHDPQESRKIFRTHGLPSPQILPSIADLPDLVAEHNRRYRY